MFQSILPRMVTNTIFNLRLWLFGPVSPEIFSRPIHHDPSSLSGLESLPIELLLMIVDRLSSAELTCLLLCSHTLAWKLGERYWKVMRSLSLPDTADLLLQFQKDHNNMYYCYARFELHYKDTTRHTLPQSRYDFHRNNREFVLLGDRYGLTFGHVQRVRQLGEASPGLSWGGWYQQPLEYGAAADVMGPDALTFAAYQMHLVQGRVIMKTQCIVNINSLFLEGADWLLGIMRCRHLSSCTDAELQALWRRLYSCGKHPLGDTACTECNTIETCGFCPSEFRIQIIPSRGKNLGTMHLTTWRDLGEGRTPTDPAWKAQIDITHCDGPWRRDEHGWKRDEYGIGSIQSKYSSSHSSQALSLLPTFKTMWDKEIYESAGTPKIRRSATWYHRETPKDRDARIFYMRLYCEELERMLGLRPDS